MNQTKTMTEKDMTFANELSATIKKSGKSVKEFAESKGTSTSTLYRYMKDGSYVPDAKRQAQLLDAKWKAQKPKVEEPVDKEVLDKKIKKLLTEMPKTWLANMLGLSAQGLSYWLGPAGVPTYIANEALDKRLDEIMAASLDERREMYKAAVKERQSHHVGEELTGVDAKVRELYDQGLTQKEIAEKVGLPLSTAKSRVASLRKAGHVVPKKQLWKKTDPDNPDLSKLTAENVRIRDMYLNDIRPNEIAKKLGLSKVTVYDRVRRLHDAGYIKAYQKWTKKEIEAGKPSSCSLTESDIKIRDLYNRMVPPAEIEKQLGLKKYTVGNSLHKLREAGYVTTMKEMKAEKEAAEKTSKAVTTDLPVMTSAERMEEENEGDPTKRVLLPAEKAEKDAYEKLTSDNEDFYDALDLIEAGSAEADEPEVKAAVEPVPGKTETEQNEAEAEAAENGANETEAVPEVPETVEQKVPEQPAAETTAKPEIKAADSQIEEEAEDITDSSPARSKDDAVLAAWRLGFSADAISEMSGLPVSTVKDAVDSWKADYVERVLGEKDAKKAKKRQNKLRPKARAVSLYDFAVDAMNKWRAKHKGISEGALFQMFILTFLTMPEDVKGQMKEAVSRMEKDAADMLASDPDDQKAADALYSLNKVMAVLTEGKSLFEDGSRVIALPESSFEEEAAPVPVPDDRWEKVYRKVTVHHPEKTHDVRVKVGEKTVIDQTGFDEKTEIGRRFYVAFEDGHEMDLGSKAVTPEEFDKALEYSIDHDDCKYRLVNDPVYRVEHIPAVTHTESVYETRKVVDEEAWDEEVEETVGFIDPASGRLVPAPAVKATKN